MREHELQKIREALELIATYCFNHRCTECPLALTEPWDYSVCQCIVQDIPTLWQTAAIGENPNFKTDEEAAE